VLDEDPALVDVGGQVRAGRGEHEERGRDERRRGGREQRLADEWPFDPRHGDIIPEARRPTRKEPPRRPV
jgi:hypothetical protein